METVTLEHLVEDFLGQRRIAVAGVSRTKSDAANIVYKKLRGAGYEVFAVNPNAEMIEGDPAYHDLGAIPGGVDGVVVATRPEAADGIVRECAQLGIPRVWMHRSFGAGSVSDSAVRFCHERGIRVIAGGCPMMFCAPVDVPHKCLRWVLRLTGGLPKSG
jgi:predicted CoA-binding protein